MKYESVEELLNAPEGEHYEFKEAKTDFDFHKALKYCCALANCGGGKLILGITDRRPREVVGSTAFEQPERTKNGLMEKLRIQVDFYLYEYNDKRILVFEVASRPIGLPVQVDGNTWWRKGDSLIPMPPEVKRNIFAETGHDFSGDICPGAAIQDLDINAIEAFRLKWAEKSGNTRINILSVKQLLIDCEAIMDNGITYAALILFGTHQALGRFLPQSEIVFEYRSSDASGPPQQREEFRVGFFACYDRIWEIINLRNDKQHYQDGLFVFDQSMFNERVVREALLNAVSHRNYQLSGNVFVRQYRDRLVVESPGGFPLGVTLDIILNKQSPRNRRISEILALCGLVERSGQGMNLIYELSIMEAKSLPDFKGTDDYNVCITLNGLVIDIKMLVLIRNIGKKRLEILSTDDFLVINALFHKLILSDNLRSRILQLTDIGIIEHTGRNKYVLARSLYEATDELGVNGSNREVNKELIFKHIKQNGVIGTPFKELYKVLPKHTRGQIQALLKELQTDKRIFVEGNTSAAKWFVLAK
jgi:ATP-dependent DNA helicase RecG